MFTSLVKRFREYPPLLQWTLIVLGVAAAVMVWHALAWQPAQTMSARAAEYEALAARAQATQNRLDGQAVRDAALALGAKKPLGTEIETTEALSEAINRILTAYHVEGRDVTERAPVAFGASEMRPLVRARMKGWRAATEVRFDTTQSNAFAIIADLESDPAVESVTNVLIAPSQQGGGDKVGVRMTVEAWYLAPADRARARGSIGS